MNEGEILELPVAEIGPGPLVRAERLDEDHAELLRPALDLVPPILVRETAGGWSLIDGQHRLSAAKREGREKIRAVVAALSDSEALGAAIKANIGHGKALTLDERKAAALELATSTDWSDRRIAETCGVHRSTVAKIRPGCPPGETDHPDTRTGADGKAYRTPALAAAARRRAVAAYQSDPTLSVRALAKVAQCSKGTAEDVIAQAKTSDGEAPTSSPSDAPGQVPAPVPVPPSDGTPACVADEDRREGDGSGPSSAAPVTAGDAVPPAASPALPADWRTDLANACYLLRLPVALLADAMGEDDAADLKTLFTHVGDALDIYESIKADPTKEQNA